MKHITVVQADITTLTVDAIVNSAKSSLTGGSGVDGAIHKAAGPELLEECWELAPCFEGTCVVTKPYRLNCRCIIHTVAPHWRGGNNKEVELLKSCYRSVLDAAKESGLHSIAIPCIGVGAYGIPHELGARVAVQTTWEHDFDGEIVFCCFEPQDKAIYTELLRQTSSREEKSESDEKADKTDATQTMPNPVINWDSLLILRPRVENGVVIMPKEWRDDDDEDDDY